MIGTLDPNKKEVTIVGAGISGLLIGYFLQKNGFKITILETTSRAGGLIQSEHTPHGLVEKAAHSLLVSPEVQSFFDELEIPLLDVRPESRSRFIVRGNRMRRMPLHLGEIAQTLARVFSQPREAITQEQLHSLTLEQWGHRYIGVAPTRWLLAPFVTGVFACQPDELSAQLAFPKLVPKQTDQSLMTHLRAQKKKGPRTPRPKMKAVSGGMENLVQTLAKKLEGCIRYQTQVESLAPFLSSSNVIITVPAPKAARLLENLDPKSSAALGQVRYSPLVTVTSFYFRNQFLPSPPRGVGVLIPRDEPYRILGCLFNSSSFSGRVHNDSLVSLTTMIGGTTDPEALDLSESEIHALLEKEHHELLGAQGPAKANFITRWKHAIPIYNATLHNARAALTSGFCSMPGRVVFSNYSDQVSVRGMIETLCKTPLHSVIN